MLKANIYPQSQQKTMCQIQYLKKWNDFLLTYLYLTAQEMILCCTEWLLFTSLKNKHPNFLPYELFFRRNIIRVMYQQNYQSQNKEIRKLKRYQERWYTSKSFFIESPTNEKKKVLWKPYFWKSLSSFKETLGELDSNLFFLSSFTLFTVFEKEF